MLKYILGKKQKFKICPELKVDSWKDEKFINSEDKYELKDVFAGKEDMKDVKEKKYLGSIIYHYMKNTINIKEKQTKALVL